MFHSRNSIETFCGDQVAQRRKEYSAEDNRLIEEFLSAKKASSLKLDAHVMKDEVQESLIEDGKY